MPPSYGDKSDAYKDAIATKFGLRMGYDSRRRLTNVVYTLAKKMDVRSEALWECLSSFERDKLAMELPDAAAACTSTLKAIE